MDVDTESPTTTQGGSRGSWRDLLRWSAIATMVVIVVVLGLSREVIPPLILGFVLLAIGLWLLRRPGKAGVLTVGIVSLLLFLANLPFAIPAFAHPDSAWDFVLIGLMTVSLLVSVIAAFATLRSSGDDGKPRQVGLAAAGISLVIVAVGLVAGLTAKDDASVAGDIALEAKSIEWNVEALTARAGTIGVYVDNKDQTRHDFHIDDIVTADLPAGKKSRVTFEAPAGSYEFTCTLHPDQMKGTLTVT